MVKGNKLARARRIFRNKLEECLSWADKVTAHSFSPKSRSIMLLREAGQVSTISVVGSLSSTARAGAFYEMVINCQSMSQFEGPSSKGDAVHGRYTLFCGLRFCRRPHSCLPRAFAASVLQTTFWLQAKSPTKLFRRNTVVPFRRCYG